LGGSTRQAHAAGGAAEISAVRHLPARLSPITILFVGTLATVLWTVLADRLLPLEPEVLAVLGLGGLFASAMCAAGSIVQNHVFRSADRELERTERRATTDPLTGLLNRAGLFRELGRLLEGARRSETYLGVLFIDLDRFKVVNDSLGHDMGDELLRVLGARLVNTVRSSDAVARLGGDEFVVVCAGLLSPDAVMKVGRHLATELARPVRLRGGAQQLSASIGIAIADANDARSPSELVRDADVAMFVAKRGHEELAVFDEDERRRAIERHHIEVDLRAALERGELRVHYQPIVEPRAGTVTGYEALVRWAHPSGGLLGPAHFLAVAEDARLIVEIGHWVLFEACSQMAAWGQAGADAATMTISVNVAEQQLLDQGFVDRVAEVLRATGLPPHQLTLEITEGVVAAHLEELDVLYALRDLGVSFAIDDFGTGQSSLSMLRQFDMVSVLKIDKEFVRSLSHNSTDAAIVQAVVSLARALGLVVVAEGVEAPEQLHQLVDLGVDRVQGFLFDGPLAATEVAPAGRSPALRRVPKGPSGVTLTETSSAGPRSRSAPRPHRPRPVRDLDRS
jgi:diguanylate cyclase (GGDEF)-like protein